MLRAHCWWIQDVSPKMCVEDVAELNDQTKAVKGCW